MVIIIDFTSQSEQILFSKNIGTDVKNTSNLFTHIIQQLKDKYSDIKLQNSNSIIFNTTIQLKKIFVEIKDSTEGNFLKLDFTSKKSRFKQYFYSLSRKQLFGVRLSSVTILIAIISVLSVLVTVFWQNTQALLIVGIASLVLAVLAVVFYNPLLKIFSCIQSKRYKALLEISNVIEKLISDYPNQKTVIRRCWSCFNEVSLSQNICENCKKSLVDKH